MKDEGIAHASLPVSHSRSVWLYLRLVSVALILPFPVAGAAQAQKPAPLKSGLEFASPEIRAMQADDFGNPGMLWVARGEALWKADAGKSGKSCAACHGDARKSMKGVAARYPRIDPDAARLVNL